MLCGSGYCYLRSAYGWSYTDMYVALWAIALHLSGTPICILAQTYTHIHMLKTKFLNNNGLNQATTLNSSEFIRLKGWWRSGAEQFYCYSPMPLLAPPFHYSSRGIDFFDLGSCRFDGIVGRENKSIQQAHSLYPAVAIRSTGFDLNYNNAYRTRCYCRIKEEIEEENFPAKNVANTRWI